MLPALPINNTRGKKKSKTFLTCNQKFKYNEGNNQAFSLLFVLNNLLHGEIHVFIMWLFFLNCLGRCFNTSTFNNKGTLENLSLCVRWAKRFDTMTFNAAVIQEKWYTGYHNQPWPECWSTWLLPGAPTYGHCRNAALPLDLPFVLEARN